MDTVVMVVGLGVLVGVLVSGGLVMLRWHLAAERARSEGQQALVARLLDVLDQREREEVANLLSIIGVEPRPLEGDVRQDEPPPHNQHRERQEPSTRPDSGVAAIRGQWDMPMDPGDLMMPFDDPTDLSNPLDQIPDALAPEQGQPWHPVEPVAYPEPVPEGEWRQGASGFAAGENPLSDIGIQPVWRDE